MEMTNKTREELEELICQALNQREQKTTANKRVFCSVCQDFERQLKQFNYTKTFTYVDAQGANGENPLP